MLLNLRSRFAIECRIEIGRRDADLVAALTDLLDPEAIPYLAALRLKDPGLRKFAEWQNTWALQRREDAGETVTIPVPPKYTSGDFRKPSYWRARGKLDVPKERFIAYPGAGRETVKSRLRYAMDKLRARLAP